MCFRKLISLWFGDCIQFTVVDIETTKFFNSTFCFSINILWLIFQNIGWFPQSFKRWHLFLFLVVLLVFFRITMQDFDSSVLLYMVIYICPVTHLFSFVNHCPIFYRLTFALIKFLYLSFFFSFLLIGKNHWLELFGGYHGNLVKFWIASVSYRCCFRAILSTHGTFSFLISWFLVYWETLLDEAFSGCLEFCPKAPLFWKYCFLTPEKRWSSWRYR